VLKKHVIVSLLMVMLLKASSCLAEDIQVQLTPGERANLTAPMSGQIMSIRYQDGEVFKNKSLLVQFECGEQKARLSQVKARLDRAQGIKDASAQLLELGSESRVDFNIKKANLAEANAEKELVLSAVKRCTIYAPFQGRVGQLDVEQHDIVQQGQPLIEILNDKTLNVEMIVPSHWMSFLKPGYLFPVNISETGQAYQSEIVRLGGKVDPVTQSIKLYGRIDNTAYALRAGMSGYAKIIPPEQKIIDEQDAPKTEGYTAETR